MGLATQGVYEPICTEDDKVVVHGVLPHSGVPLPPGTAAPTLLAHTELPCPVGWAPGAGAGTHRLSRRVFASGERIMLWGHDCGPQLPHVVAPPIAANALLAQIMAASSRKAHLGAPRILIEGTPLGSGTVMLACAEPVPMPVAQVTGAERHRVVFRRN
jgi:hypothetical protein